MSEPSGASSPEVELNELIALAERSTATIDTLAAEFSQGQLQILLTAFLTMVTTVSFLLVSLSAFVGSLSIGGYQGVTQAAFITLSLSVGVGGIYVLHSRLMRLRRLKRDLALERDISARLLSMIDDQYHRVSRASPLSPVALATIEIRVRRLDRSTSSQ